MLIVYGSFAPVKSRRTLPISGSFKRKELCFGAAFFVINEEGKMDNLRFYKVDMKYIRNLAAVDRKVMSVSPQTNKDTRPFLGIIVICDDKQYCIPLTSPKDKHIEMRNREDFSRMFDTNGKLIGALNFNNMIPVTNDVISPLNIVINDKDSYAEKGRKKILNVQLDWCNTNKEIIVRKANKLYHLVVDTPNKMRNLTRRCCNFTKLEAVLERYIKRLFKNPVYREISDREKVADILDKNGIVYDISPEQNEKGNYALKVNAEDSEKVKQLISAPKKNITLK